MTARWPLVLNGTTIQELQTGDTLNGVSSFDSGTAMLFVQTSAPTGWTKSTTHNDKALRIVSGTASSGGSYTFSSTFTNGNSGATTLSVSQMPSHGHDFFLTGANWGPPSTYVGTGSPFTSYTTAGGASGSSNVSPNGGGGAHTHSLSLAVAYVDAIIAVKD